MKKIIHYCWFGKTQKPDIVLKCIKSWQEKCPGFEIVEWNESNFDVSICQYVQEAYKYKKWAFVSDFCRYFVLFKFGGIYLDTDVEIIKKLDYLPDAFVGFESEKYVASGLIRGAKKNDEICRLMLESYYNDRFVNKDGSLNLMTVCKRETDILLDKGLSLNNKLQIIGETTIYPKEYFCPKDFFSGKITITNNTYTIHHYASSWYSEKERYAYDVQKYLIKYFGKYMSSIIGASVATLRYDGLLIFIKKVKSKIVK